MKILKDLFQISSLLLIYELIFATSVMAYSVTDEFQIHGFLTQGFYHSSDNNFYGDSDDGISPGLTEIGLNFSYQAFDQLSFTAQGLYRRAGNLDRGSVRLDHAVADLNLLHYENGHIGFRGGRIKIPFGLYNETRDVAFLNPSIIIPQGLYFDRSRSLLVSADGGSLYAEHRSPLGDFLFKFNAGMPVGDHEELKSSILRGFGRGSFTAEPAFATQLSYEWNAGQVILAVSYMDFTVIYNPTVDDALSPGKTEIKPLLFSAQYNAELYSITAEYGIRENIFKGFGVSLPNRRSYTESWYIQGSYRVLSELELVLRYDTLSMNVDDRGGNGFERLGLPKHMGYAKDWMVGFRWDITSTLMVRAEYHRIHGTAWLPQADNPDRSLTRQDWDLYALQFSFHF